MKREPEPSRIYYDVSIEHEPSKIDQRYGYASKAEKMIFLKEPLIENPGDFNLSISKFNINTQTIPIMIPEVKQPVDVKDLKKHWFPTTFRISLLFEYTITGKSKVYINEHEDVYIRTHKNKFDIKTIGVKNGTTQKYVDNTDEQCFVYDYFTLLDGLSEAFSRIRDRWVKLDPNIIGYLSKPFAYFDISETGRIRFKFDNWIVSGKNDANNKPLITINTKAEFMFSPNLYKYIGNGFKTRICKWEDEDKGMWEYVLEDTLCTKNIYSADDYDYIIQEYPTLSNWHCLKAMIIGSDMLPVVEEYIPIAHKDGFLLHYETTEYKEALADLGIVYEKGRDEFSMNSQKVLDVYYPLSSAGGDIRSNIIHSRENLNDGQNIELMPGSPIDRFNIWIKWLDVYGNIYDLYLMPGCTAEIRMCFTKKTLAKEDLAEGLEAVIDRLPEKRERKAKKSNGKPDGIVLEGADKYGFIHL